MNVVGFKEALAGSVEVKLPLDLRTLVVSLAGLIVLKIFAWAERHASEPGRDAYDISAVLANYLDAGNEERLFSEHLDVLELAEFDWSRAGARILGRDTAALLRATSAEPDTLRARMLSIIEPETDPDRSTAMIAEAGTANAEEFRRQLLWFASGLNE